MDRIVRIFVGLLVMLGANTALSYPTPVDFEGKLLRWQISIEEPTVRFNIDAEPEVVTLHEEFIETAAQYWTDVPTSYIALQHAAETETVHITIKIRDSMSDGSFSSGFAVFDEKDNGGNPLHCTIEVSSAETIGYMSFGKTILHEFGHCMGLGHSLVPEAIMGYSLDRNDFVLDTDDIAAISRLYPADGSKPQLPPGCGIYMGKTHSHSLLSWLILFLPVAVGMAVKVGRAL